MQLNKLSEHPKLVIGVKQTTKILINDRAAVVFVAKDAEQHVTRRIIQIAEEKGVELIYVDTMKALGSACKIDVGAATAVIEK